MLHGMLLLVMASPGTTNDSFSASKILSYTLIASDMRSTVKVGSDTLLRDAPRK